MSRELPTKNAWPDYDLQKRVDELHHALDSKADEYEQAMHRVSVLEHFTEQLQQVAESLGMPVAPGHSVVHRVKELVAEKEQLRLERNRACRERDASDTEIEWVKRICFGGELPCVKPNSEVFEIFAAIKKQKDKLEKTRKNLHRSMQLFGNMTGAYRKLSGAAQAVVDRWETPLWKDAEPTAEVIYRLRDTLTGNPTTNELPIDCELVESAIDILDGNADPIDWRDQSQPELLRKLCEHLEAFNYKRGQKVVHQAAEAMAYSQLPQGELATPAGCPSFRQWKAGVAQAIADEKNASEILPNGGIQA